MKNFLLWKKALASKSVQFWHINLRTYWKVENYPVAKKLPFSLCENLWSFWESLRLFHYVTSNLDFSSKARNININPTIKSFSLIAFMTILSLPKSSRLPQVLFSDIWFQKIVESSSLKYTHLKTMLFVIGIERTRSLGTQSFQIF